MPMFLYTPHIHTLSLSHCLASLSGVWCVAVAYNSPPIPLHGKWMYIPFNNIFFLSVHSLLLCTLAMCWLYGLQSFAGTPAVLKCRRLSHEEKNKKKIKTKKISTKPSSHTSIAIRRPQTVYGYFWIRWRLPFWLLRYQCYQNHAADSKADCAPVRQFGKFKKK